MRGRTLSAATALAVFAGMTVTLAAQPVTASPSAATTAARPIAAPAAALAAPDISVTNVQAHLTQFNTHRHQQRRQPACRLGRLHRLGQPT